MVVEQTYNEKIIELPYIIIEYTSYSYWPEIKLINFRGDMLLIEISTQCM